MRGALDVIRALIPGSLRNRFWQSVSRLVDQRLSTIPVAKYAPYMGNAACYAIPKQPEECQRCCSGLPIPPKPLWVGYGDTVEGYLASGQQDVDTMLRAVQESGVGSLEGCRILDLGCAGGRMIRHLKQQAESGEVWGTDISAECIYWCKQHLSPPFRFATTTTIPHLPFEDGYFDLVYCGSVFTHIDDLAEAWLLEIRRVLAPSGRFFFTIHDEHTSALLDGPRSDHLLFKDTTSNEIYNERKNDAAMLVVGRGSGSQVFYDRDYFCRHLKPLYEIHRVIEEAYGYQTGILVSKRS